MAVSYRKLWHLMLDKKINKSGLEKLAGISHHSILKMNRDEDVSTEVLTKICSALQCNVQDIVEFLPDNSHSEET
ncbi:MAG: helix-turn-helix transcriptional regulator [Clostridia bacterium]|nr:helix-turn-helix transcriptional regulator [Clostridia bacterium]